MGEYTLQNEEVGMSVCQEHIRVPDLAVVANTICLAMTMTLVHMSLPDQKQTLCEQTQQLMRGRHTHGPYVLREACVCVCFCVCICARTRSYTASWIVNVCG